MTLFDSHAHLNHPLFDGDREEIIKKLCDSDIKVLNIGNDLEDSKKTLALAGQCPNVMWAAVGIHPDEDKNNLDFGELKSLAENKNVVAIGECGLDYFRIKNNELGIKEKQRELFERQIQLAQELNKPLIIHCRPSLGTMDAYEDVINIILDSRFQILDSNNGAIHFFSGSKEIAEKFLDLGFYISFAGPITYSDQYKKIVQYVPLDRILAETDSPFAAPAPHRGKRNEPAFVEFVVRRIAEWKGLDFEAVARQTSENAKELFKV